jgi:hypothetical protein
MTKTITGACLLLGCAIVSVVAEQQTFTGKISDSTCGASHEAKAVSASLTERQCVIACVKALSKYVLVDENEKVIAIENQDAMGLPFHAGHAVKVTGERKGDAIAVTKVEARPPDSVP